MGRLPATAEPAAPARFVVDELEPRFAQARAGPRAVFFVEAAHCVLAPFLGFLWSVTRIFLRAPAGRHRVKVLGALHATTHDLVTVTHDPSMTATEVCPLFRRLAALHLGVPVPVVLDHARYPRCAQVVPLAASLHLELGFLPPYSPNLTLLERWWKFVKKQGLSSTYYADFAAFKPASVQCLAQTQTTHGTALGSLLTFRFQLFAKAQFFPA